MLPECRYPIGGDSQSVTSGVVSRIEVTAHVHSCHKHLSTVFLVFPVQVPNRR